MYQKQHEGKIYSHLMLGMFENMLNWIFNPKPQSMAYEECSQKVVIHIRDENWYPRSFFDSQIPDIENQLGPFYHTP